MEKQKSQVGIKMVNLKEYLEAKVASKTLVIYPGRFQPFHKGHLSVYELLIKKFGKDSVYVLTSNKTDTKSPLTFKEKKSLINKVVPSSKIIEMKGSAYNAKHIASSLGIPEASLSDHKLIVALSQKDADRIKGGKYYEVYKGKTPKNADKAGYVFKLPTLKAGDEDISATAIRNAIKEKDWDKVSDLVPYDKNILKKLQRKFV